MTGTERRPVADEKVAEVAFLGALAVLAILVAAVGLIAAEKHGYAAGVDYLENPYIWLDWFTAGISVVSGVLALASLSVLRGGRTPIKAVAILSRLLIVGTVAATLVFVWLT